MQSHQEDPNLANVPVVLTTATSTDVTIEQHRQRPNHQDSYVRKPVAVDELVEHLRNLVGLGENVNDTNVGDEDNIVIDDDVLDVEEPAEESARPRISVIPEDSDVASFADAAFQGLMAEPDVAPRPAPVKPSRVPPETLTPWHRSAASCLGSRQGEASYAGVRARGREGPIAELEAKDFSDKELEIDNLRKELEDTKARLSSAGRPTTGGSQAREVLDLREQLHKKEKELLNLRDKVTQREKEVLSLKDASLSVERDKADTLGQARRADASTRRDATPRRSRSRRQGNRQQAQRRQQAKAREALSTAGRESAGARCAARRNRGRSTRPRGHSGASRG
ncbi:MAG: hypothetical protein QM784_21715 [Polyangiaceae bacterium]